jgi:putative hemolysin
MSTELTIIFFLLLLNAFFALSEMAIVSASKPLLRQYAKQGKKSAAVALDLAENSGRFLSTVQVGITLVGTLAGAYGGATIAEKLKEPFNEISLIAPHGETIAVVLVVALITYFSVVIGELVPKQLALNNAERFAMLVARPMAMLSKICTPLVVLLEHSAKALLFIMRIKPKSEGVTETEIKAVIAEGVASGAIEDSEHDVIRRVIRLGDREVTSIMTHRTDVKFIDIDDSLSEVRCKIAEAGHSRYPVIDKDTTKVLGIVKTKQILAGATSEEAFKVKNFLADALFVNENTPCLEALNIFRRQSLHIAAVIDEFGSFEGLFTTSDLMEAIVGTIPSNYDNDEGPPIVQRDDGSWLVDGLTPIDEIHMTIGLEEINAGSDYQTMAGFMLSQIKAGPAAGISFELYAHKFEIVDMDKNRVDKILIRRL